MCLHSLLSRIWLAPPPYKQDSWAHLLLCGWWGNPCHRIPFAEFSKYICTIIQTLPLFWYWYNLYCFLNNFHNHHHIWASEGLISEENHGSLFPSYTQEQKQNMVLITPMLRGGLEQNWDQTPCMTLKPAHSTASAFTDLTGQLSDDKDSGTVDMVLPNQKPGRSAPPESPALKRHTPWHKWNKIK